MYVCMYVCMYVRMYVMYVYLYVCTYVCMYVCMGVCLCVSTCICLYVCVRMCVFRYVSGFPRGPFRKLSGLGFAGNFGALARWTPGQRAILGLGRPEIASSTSPRLRQRTFSVLPSGLSLSVPTRDFGFHFHYRSGSHFRRLFARHRIRVFCNKYQAKSLILPPMTSHFGFKIEI